MNSIKKLAPTSREPQRGQNRPAITIVCPMLNEEDAIGEFHVDLVSACSALGGSVHIIYVDDGSTDRTVESLVKAAGDSPVAVQVLRLTRNFGKEAALSAGIHHATGDIVVTIDSDGEHPPGLIGELVDHVRSGSCDVAVGVRTTQPSATRMKQLSSWVFRRAMRVLGAANDRPETAPTDFRAFTRRVAESFANIEERGRLVRSLLDWPGYRTEIVTFEAAERLGGSPSYRTGALARSAVDVITSGSYRPLYFSVAAGLTLAVGSMATLVFLIIEHLLLGDPLGLNITGSAYLISAALLGLAMVILNQGLLGLYLSRIHTEAVARPLYVIDAVITVNSDEA